VKMTMKRKMSFSSENAITKKTRITAVNEDVAIVVLNEYRRVSPPILAERLQRIQTHFARDRSTIEQHQHSISVCVIYKRTLLVLPPRTFSLGTATEVSQSSYQIPQR